MSLASNVAEKLGKLFWLGLLTAVLYGFVVWEASDSFAGAFHKVAFWLPAIAILTVISAHLDLLGSIQKGGEVNIKARALDFIHWLMLIALNIGAWMIGGVTVGWFLLKLILLAIIGWQVGVGAQRRWQFSSGEKSAGLLAVIFAVFLGLATGAVRAMDATSFGWGWSFEAVTAVVATSIAFWKITLDISIISRKAAGYPRTFFWKALTGNMLILLFWVHIMLLGSFGELAWWGRNAALTFNVLVGNALFLLFYGVYEFFRAKQKNLTEVKGEIQWQ